MAKYTVVPVMVDGTVLVRWDLSAADAKGEAYPLPPYRSASVQVGLAAGVVEWQGSLTPDGFVETLLHDGFGAPAMLGSCELKTVEENVYRIRPGFTGDGDVTAYLLIRRL